MDLVASLEVIKKNFIELAKLTDADMQLLKTHFPTTKEWGKDLAEAFYQRLLANAATAAVFVPGEMEARHRTLLDWYASVAGGNIDEQFWKTQYRIGLIHIKRGVRNEYMASMMGFVQDQFLLRAQAAFDAPTATQLSSSFNKVSGTIQTVIAEGYRLGYLEAIISTAGLSVDLLDNIVRTTIDDLLNAHR